MRRLGTLAVLVAASVLASAAPAHADSYVVETVADDVSAPPCEFQVAYYSCPMLRSAIEAANASPNDDTITVPAGTVNLDGEPLTVTSDIVILGAGVDSTIISGGGDSRVFHVDADGLLTLTVLTVANGHSPEQGGNILVSPDGSLSLLYTRVTDGQAATGGAISNSGSLSVGFSQIDNNTATNLGGAIHNSGGTGGAASMQVINSTVAFNNGTGAIASTGNEANELALTHATIARNPGGGVLIQAPQQNTMAIGSLIAFNGASNCPQLPFADATSNIENGATCGFTGSTNRQNTDPQIGTALTYDGGQFATQVLKLAATSPAIDFVYPCYVPIDQRGEARYVGTGLAACDAGAYELTAAGSQPPPPPPQPPPPPPTPTPTPTPAPTPEFRQTAVVEPTGTVRVKLKGSKRFVTLDATQGIPFGSEVDAKKGAVVVRAITKPGRPAAEAKFYDGIFKLTQAGDVIDLTLTEQLAPCPKRKAKRASAAAKKPKTRRLWGDGKGKFRTKGRYAAATVRGTKWLVQDSCAGTLTRVTQGSVTVRDLVRKKNVIVKKGKSYTARPKK
jgi:hypothetical protein